MKVKMKLKIKYKGLVMAHPEVTEINPIISYTPASQAIRFQNILPAFLKPVVQP